MLIPSCVLWIVCIIVVFLWWYLKSTCHFFAAVSLALFSDCEEKNTYHIYVSMIALSIIYQVEVCRLTFSHRLCSSKVQRKLFVNYGDVRLSVPYQMDVTFLLHIITGNCGRVKTKWQQNWLGKQSQRHGMMLLTLETLSPILQGNLR